MPSESISVSSSIPQLHSRSRTNSLLPSLNTSYSPHTHIETSGSFVLDPSSSLESLRLIHHRVRPRVRSATTTTTRPVPRRSLSEIPSQIQPHAQLRNLITSLRRSASRSSSRRSSLSIPALSRTSSPEPEEEDNRLDTPLLTTPPSRPLLISPSDSVSPSTLPLPSFPTLHPKLAAIEKRSRLKSRVLCSVCHKVGDDFPRCSRCGAAWCSRKCRLGDDADPVKGKQKRHMC